MAFSMDLISSHADGRQNLWSLRTRIICKVVAKKLHMLIPNTQELYSLNDEGLPKADNLRLLQRKIHTHSETKISLDFLEKRI